ncbi:unnamed protein product [Caenorhabditis sp. 36 PRJEB53466]|nr:unnamed protein product [Caenorhabditis sp. 36 PRJEB53466]
MQTGDHQILAGNGRTFVPKASGAQNASFAPNSHTVRMVDQNGHARMVQMAAPSRPIIGNGGGPHVVRQMNSGNGGQQFQQNYAQGGTIASRSVGGMPVRTVVQGTQQHVYQRSNGGQIVQQHQQRTVYMAASGQQNGGQIRYVQTSQNQQQQAVGRVHPNQSIMQQRVVPGQTSQPQMHQRPPMHQMARQMQQIPHPAAPTSQQFYVPTGMNLAVPLREPSPEPMPVKVEEPEVPAESSIKKEEPAEPEDAPDIDIQIRNVVCNYTLPLHIDLRKLAMNTHNVTYEREKGVMMKQKRSPGCYIKVYSSGKVYIVGCRSEVDCKIAARSIARHIQRVMGKTHERVVIRNYRVNNVLATVRLPFGIKIEEVAAQYPAQSTYEPELSVGLVWRSTAPKATLRIHTTGSITITGAASENDVVEVLSIVYPIVAKFQCPERARGGAAAAQQKKRKRKAPTTRGPPIKRERFDDANFGNSGVINNQVYFSDEDEDLYDELDLDE